MLLTLHTLKAKPFQEQIRTIELLTEQNLDLFERIRPLLGNRFEDSIFHISVSTDRHKVVRVRYASQIESFLTGRMQSLEGSAR